MGTETKETSVDFPFPTLCSFKMRNSYLLIFGDWWNHKCPVFYWCTGYSGLL